MRSFGRKLGRCLYVLARHLPVSFAPVNIGQKRIRALCGRLILKRCGKNVNIEKGASFASSVCLGDNSGLGINCVIGAETVIGNDVMMGPNVRIYTQNHDFRRIDIPMCQQGFKPIAPVMIGNDVWIGESVITLPGSRIGNGVILGAGTVVRGEVPDYAVVIGNPAQVVRYRKQM